MTDAPVTKESYTCANCGGVFAFARSDDEARAEAVENFGANVFSQPVDVICDDCYLEFMPWFLRDAN